MAEKETAFSLEITVSAVLTHKDGTTEEVDDIKCLLNQFKEYQVVQKFLCKETYFHLQGASISKDELVLKCSILSDSELTDLESAVENDHLGQELTKYVISSGLETELSLSHDSDIKVSLVLELRKQWMRQGRAYFKKISKTSQKDGKKSKSKKKGGKSDDGDQPLGGASPTVSKQSVEKKPMSQKKEEERNGQNASMSGTSSSVGLKSRYSGGRKNEFPASKPITNATSVSSTDSKSGPAPKDTGNESERKGTNDRNGAAVGNSSVACMASTTPGEDRRDTVPTPDSAANQVTTGGTDLESQCGSDNRENQNPSTDKKLAGFDETGKRKDQSVPEHGTDKHLSGSNVKRIKVEDENVRSSLTPEDTGQRAAHESITKEAEEPLILKKEVLVYIPRSEVKKEYIKDVFVDFTSKGGVYSYLRMLSLDENMWTSQKVDFHPDVDDLYFCIRIHYGNKWISRYIHKVEYTWQAMGTRSIFRSILGLSDYVEGFCGHVIHILLNISEYGFKDALMQIEDLTRNIFRDRRDVESIFKMMKHCFENETHCLSPDGFSAVGYIYSKLSKNQDYKKHSKWVTSTMCQSILKGFKAISVKDIPSTMISDFRWIAESLCQVAYSKSQCHFFTVLEYCFPLFSPKYFSELLGKSISTNTFKVHDFEHIRSVVRGTYSLVSQEDEDAYCEFLERLLQHLPLEFTLAEEENVSKFKTDVENIIHKKVKKECTSAVKTRNIVQVVELHDVLSRWKRGKGDVARCIEQTVVCICENTHKTHTLDHHKLQTLLRADNLFVDPSCCVKVMEILAVSENKMLHSLFTEMLKHGFLDVCKEDVISELTRKWFEKAILLLCSDGRYSQPIDDLPHVYQYLGSALSVDCVFHKRMLVQSLKERAFKFLNSINVKTLVDKLLEIDFVEESHCQNVFAEHLQTYLLEGKEADMIGIILSKAGSTSWIGYSQSRNYSKLYEDMLVKCIEQCGIQETENDEACFLLMLKNIEFWTNLLSMAGQYEFLKTNVVLQKARGASVKVAQQLCHNTCSLLFSRKLHAALKDGFSKCTKMLLLSSKVCKKEDFDKALSLLPEAKKMAERDELFISHILSKLKLHFEGKWPDLEIAFGMFHEMQLDVHEGSVAISTLLDHSFWGPFCDFLRSCERISNVSNSQSFWNISKTVINQWLSIPDILETVVSSGPEDSICELFGEDRIENDTPCVTLKVMEILASECIVEYKNMWRPLFEGSDQSIGEIRPLLNVDDSPEEQLLAQSHFDSKLQDWVKKALHIFDKYYEYSDKVEILRKVLKILHLQEMEKTFAESVQAFTSLEEKIVDDLTLKQLFETGKILTQISQILEGELSCILEELSNSSKLVDFLRETALEDLRNLIDAVEEHSEQSVQESTVSALISVKRFLSPILRENLHSDVEHVLTMLQKSLSDSKITNLDQKISECNTHLHSLKALFHNVANRGEVTKEIVKKAVQQGSKYVFTLSQSGCDVNLKYKSHSTTRTHTYSDICDLRSRVMLMNTDVKEKGRAKKQDKIKEDFTVFKQSVDDAMNIASILTELCQSGHPEYHDKYTASFSIKDLQEHATEYSNTLLNWQTALRDSRNQYYWLNFFYPKQLRQIETHFKAVHHKGDREICDLLSFTGYDFKDMSRGKDIYSKVQKDVGHDAFSLKSVGKTLDILFQGKTPMYTPFPDTKSGRVADAVHEGELFVVGLNDDSDLVVPTLLALYKNTTGCLPVSSQVLFCQEDTLWEDIELLMRRCLGGKREKKQIQLFSIVCVENLSSELQFRLVDTLEVIEKESYLLAIICRGNAHHPFLDHFGENVHQVQPMSQSAMEECLKTLWPNVVTVLSDVPGQGKSEFIQQLAWSRHMRVCSLHVSGEMSPKQLVKKMSHLELKSSDLLHIDIGMLSKPKEVDLLLTQLIVLGFVFHGSDLVKLTTKTICIEVANTISNSLRNSLNTALCFRREMLEWQNYANFYASTETCSSVQVVCHYLQAYDCGKLDTTDLYFTGEDACRPLPQEKCRELLKKYFSSGTDMSFSVVRTFLNVLSDQLKKFSCSYFFRTTNLSGMLGGDALLKDVKSQLFRALLDVSREFATRSVHACREDQTASVQTMSQSADINQSMENLVSTSASAAAMTKRVEAMIQWEESNHLLIAFHNQDIQTLSALYRKKTLVPVHVKTLFETQVKAAMPEFSNLSHTELRDMLQRIARFKPGATSDEVMKHMSSSYALTPDNLLKMILIILRTRAHVPVIIMGETGCGKTSLIRYLSVICGVDLEIQNIHAGIAEDEIIRRVMEVNEKALNSLDDIVWLFLDEINTCNHLGLINTILCHHICQGNILAPNLVVMAACNPYKIRSDQSIFTAGLETKVQADEKSRLVYRVNPLPESMVDFVWDYGSLSDSDEKAYIKRMITGCVQEGLENCVVALLVMSQSFIRKREHSGSCVSLRDVSRCRKLIDWFKMTLKKKEKLSKKCFSSGVVLEKSSVVLALAHSYHSRLPDASSRQTYRQEIAKIFGANLVSSTEKEIFSIIQSEQQDILNRMELPQGTAKNTALQENVFVILVCILNHIPVFVVGKPGCSKSLSLQLIKSNLRGKDSKDPYFQSLPQVFCVSYQGSESSTSEGILKVFAKAEKYKENDKDNSVLPVVILDEIGLAEMSRFNPLKVLHSLLEPGDTELPNVAVVGISNWALDAAKMNRAIHLSRPDMDAEELYLTGISISETSVSDSQKRMRLSSPCLLKDCERKIDKNLVRAIANAYLQYTGEQTFKNFHGLRDFYSLVKYVSKEFSSLSDHDSIASEVQLRIIMKGLLRNFGGLSSEIHSVLTVYREHLEKLLSVNFPEMEDIPSVLDLVADNIKDKSARHLLLSTRGESALSIIEDLLDKKNRKFVSILGSRFEEDLTDDYNYRILSRIILCMEQGVVLILKDLENIYGSLYDMLNQNYTIVGSKKNCRIALGAYSNPLCHVHDDFRCIVLVEEDKLDLSDPPFLNRFEKQYMKLTELLSPTELKDVSILEDWIVKIANIHGHTFTRSDVIPIDSPDMVASLVHFVYSEENNQCDSTAHMNMCKKLVLTMCSPESIVRMDLSELQKKNSNEVQELQDYFFHLPLHNGLAHLLKARLEESKCCLKEIMFTHSNLHTNVSACMEISSVDIQSEKLGAFKSEKQLCTRIGSFWSDPSKTWLVIQCSASTDQENILLMKSVVDREHDDFVSKKGHKDQKHVIVVMHMDRNESENTLSLVNFLSGWNMTFIDSLENREISLRDLLHKRKMHLIHERRPVTSFLKQHLFWAFTLLDYHDIPRSLASLKDVVDAIVSDSQLMIFLEELVLTNLQEQLDADESQSWQLDVACDRLKLYNFLTLHDALEHEISTCIKHPLAALVYKIEASCAWDAVTLWSSAKDKDRKREVWLNFVRDKNMIDTESVPQPEGPECYVIMDSVLSLRCPFSKVFIDQIETLKEPFMDAFRAEYSDFEVDEITEDIKDMLTVRFQSSVSQAAADMFENTYSEDQFTDYFHDFCNVKFSRIKLQMTEKQRAKTMEWSILSRFTRKGNSFEYDVCSLHITCWLYGPVIESEIKLIDVCLDLTETQLDYFLQSRNLSIIASSSDSQRQAKEDLKDVSSCSSEEDGSLEKCEYFVPDVDAEAQLDGDGQPFVTASGVVDILDIVLETETESQDEVSYQREDNVKLMPPYDEIQFEDQPTSDEDEPEIAKDRLSTENEVGYQGEDNVKLMPPSDEIQCEDQPTSDEDEPEIAKDRLSTENEVGYQGEDNVKLMPPSDEIQCEDQPTSDEDEPEIAKDRLSTENEVGYQGEDNVKLMPPSDEIQFEDQPTSDEDEPEIAKDKLSTENEVSYQGEDNVKLMPPSDEIQCEDQPTSDEDEPEIAKDKLSTENEVSYQGEDNVKLMPPSDEIQCEDQPTSDEDEPEIAKDRLSTENEVGYQGEDNVKLMPPSDEIQCEDQPTSDEDEPEIAKDRLSTENEVGYQGEDNVKLMPASHEIQFEDQPTSDEDEPEIAKDELSTENELCADDCEDNKTALVSFACQELIPTERLLSRLELEKWINGVNLVLSLAGEVSQSKVFLSLRMCSDFTYVVLVPFKLSISYLHRFGQALKADTLESKTVFSIVCELVEELLEAGTVPCSVLQHFFSIYISNCLAADTENSLLDWTFSSLQSLSIFEFSLDYFGPTIFQTMLIEIESDILGEENVVAESPVLQCLEDCVETFKDNGEPDSQLACLILDVLQTNFCPQSFSLDTDTIEKVLKCDKMFKSDGLSLHHLFALAYLKNFLIHLASELNRNEAMDLHIIQKIHGIFNCDESDSDSLKNMRTGSLQTFLLKVLTQGPALKRLEEVVNEYSSEWPFVSEFQMKDEHRFLALELCPMEMTCQDVFTRVLSAYDVLPKDRTKLKNILQGIKSNPEILYGVFGVALQKIYVVQSVRRITDTERNEKVKLFWQECHIKLFDNQRQMFTNLCTMEDFAVQLLQTNPNKSAEDHHLSMCILHLVCSVLAYNSNYGVVSQKSPFWLRCIQAPKDVQKLFLPGCGYKEGELCCCTLAPVVTKKTKYARSSCSCNSVTIHDVAIEDHQCSACQQPLQDSELCHISTMDSTGYDGKGYIFVDIGCLKSEYVSVRSLSPAAFRVLQFFLHGCLCASLALKFTTKEVLSKAMQLPESVDASSYIENHLHVHWCALKHLTAMGDSQLAKLLNFIIKDCMPLIARHSVQFHSRDERELYEEEFTACIDKIMKKRFQIVQDETRLYHTRYSDSTSSRHEVLLAEIPGDGDRLAELPKLMRENTLPSIENLQREFTIRKQVHDFPMMALLFDRMKHISLLQHLIPIIQWHKCVIRYASHRLKRINCRTQTVQDFIHAPIQQLLSGDNKKTELRERFDCFMKSWNTLKGHQDDLKTYNQQLPELERIHQTALLQDCIIMTKQSPMMQVLLALKAIQNKFLSDAAVLCLSTNSLSISFLKRTAGVAVVAEVHLEHINSKQVISVPGLEDTLKFSQINTKYGHGRERHYDIYQIETQVVDECLLSKPMIKVGSSFPIINFAGESLHKTDELFESVSKIVGHDAVDKDLKNSILQLKEKSPSNMQVLLDYLQMTFSLLNRTPVSGSDKNQYLSEFLQTWQSLFPNRVKEVDGLCSRVRLCQIISVYELTEDVMADVIFDGIEEKYRSKLPEECMKQLSALMRNIGLRFQEALISALKKIVFRYVQSGFVSQDDKLAPRLMEKTLWPQGVYEDVVAKSRNPDAGLLHDAHCIEHIYWTIVFIAESVEEKRVREEKKSALFQPVTKKTDKTQRRQKKALNFRKK